MLNPHCCGVFFLQATFMHTLLIKYLQNQVRPETDDGSQNVPAVTSAHFRSDCTENCLSDFQGIVWPPVINGLLVNLLNALLNYIFLFVFHLGVA